MRIRKIYELQGSEFIHDKPFIMGSTVLELANDVQIVCSSFKQNEDKKILVYVWNPSTNKWGTALMNDEYSRKIWEFHKKKYKFRKEFRGANWENMMRHSRRHKHGTGGVRLGKFCGQVTDYECKKDPFFDFRRVWN